MVLETDSLSSHSLSPVINAAELLEYYSAEELVIVNASNGKNAKALYIEKHLDQAVYVDLDSQLSNIKTNVADGGRHPLPTVYEFTALLQTLGIAENSHVVVYDNNFAANAAARFWWMLKAIGHKKVQVLNGGFQQAEKMGLPINNTAVAPNQVGVYNASAWTLPQAEMAEVVQLSERDDYTVIDVREPKRYRGEFEPIDQIAGHIPGAINMPLAINLNDEGLFVSKRQIRDNYKKVVNSTNSANTIVHCGSGVTACHTILAMDYAGLELPKLYVGSWSEWSRNGNKIATGDD